MCRKVKLLLFPSNPQIDTVNSSSTMQLLLSSTMYVCIYFMREVHVYIISIGNKIGTIKRERNNYSKFDIKCT